MAPITRSSQYGRPSTAVGFPMDRAVPDSDMFQDLAQIDDEGMDASDIEDMVDVDEGKHADSSSGPPLTHLEMPNQSLFNSSVNDLLQPLQETAERIGKQIEDFAKALDKFNAARETSDQELWKDAWALLDQYREITNRRKDQTQEHPKVSKKRQSLGDNKRQIQNLQLEADLWNLTSAILVCKSPQAVQDAQVRQNACLADLHRYSTNDEIWNAFLDSDIVAQEYESILDWLQGRATTSSPSIDTIVSELEKKAEHGEGIWTAGQIFTKDSIKKQKRARALPVPLTPDMNGLKQTHIKQADGEPLVTQLDPDAPMRQDASLEVQDEYAELAAWQVYWEMLRRGWHADEIREWWADRNELWRSVTTQVAAKQIGDGPSPWQRIANLASSGEFLTRCKQISINRACDTDFEVAVYAILSGSFDPALPVCASIDDCLFALLNALLIERYQDFLTAYEQRLQDASLATYLPHPSTIAKVSDFLQTKQEALQPYKLVESAIVSQNFEELLVGMGRAAAAVAEQVESGHLYPQKDTQRENQEDESFKTAARDEDTTRTVAHLQLVLTALGVLQNDEYADDLDNNIVNYIALLERNKKYSLLPLYASKLQADRAPAVLAPILVNVIQSQERSLLTKLMNQFGIASHQVIYLICEFSRESLLPTIDGMTDSSKCARITESSAKITKIKSGFLHVSEALTDEEEKVIAAHEWVKHIDVEHWGMATWSMAALYKTLLLHGRLPAAKQVASAIDLRSTSLKCTGMNLSLAILVSDPGLDPETIDMVTSQDYDNMPASPNKKRRDTNPKEHILTTESVDRSSLAKKSIVWSQLEQLVGAFDALDLWQTLADDVEAQSKSHKDPRAMKKAKQELRQTLQAVIDSMQPLLEPLFLDQPYDEDERFVLDLIRNHYLPECVLAYNSALYFAGHALTRQHLVQCMDLAQTVAQNATLTSAFTESKRMQELVTAFAHDSQALLRANESSKSGAESAKGRASIWQVTWNESA